MARKVFTYTEIKTILQNDLDIEEEDFVTATELKELVNRAIDDAESHIHNLYEDYFLTSAPLAMVNGTASYDMPTDIYADKIRYIEYNMGTNLLKFEVKRIRDYRQISIQNEVYGSPPLYMYWIKNAEASSGLPKFTLCPAAQETSSSKITIYYIRNAKRIVDDSDVIDIPEFANYILAHVKKAIYEKEGNPRIQIADQKLKEQLDLMTNTLTDRVDDGNTDLIINFDPYGEMF